MDYSCQIFHHASPIPGSRIHWLAIASGPRKRISHGSDTEGFLLHACATHRVPRNSPTLCLRAWGIRPSGPAKLNSDCQARRQRCWCWGGTKRQVGFRAKAEASRRRFDDGRLELISLEPGKAWVLAARRLSAFMVCERRPMNPGFTASS